MLLFDCVDMPDCFLSTIQALISSWKKGDTMPFIFDTVRKPRLLVEKMNVIPLFLS